MLVFHDPVPDIAGQTCEELLVQAHYYRGMLANDANVLFLKVRGGAWHRIFIEAGVVFWQEVDGLDSPDQDRHHYTLTDLATAHGFAGKRLVDVRTVDRESGGELQLLFAGAPRIVFTDVAGGARVVVDPGSAESPHRRSAG
jgi:hypothetical protein